ncbi:MAG: hypothetical protein CO070_08885, partial [Gallionellales bacterium CG_4_9_14_0_8_um_filter_55_61]
MTEAEKRNADGHTLLNGKALQDVLRAQGETWSQLVAERCPHLFAAVPLFISPLQLQQMRDGIAAVERVVKLPGWSV